jgi:aminoglycoside 3-N-acetyltransferase
MNYFRKLTQIRPGLVRRFRRFVRNTRRLLSRPDFAGPQIVSDLWALGVRPGGILLVHSSLSSLGHVAGGARSVIQALIESVGPGGTLVLPAHTWRRMTAGCRVFDARKTEACVGAIPESFRRMPGVVRSLHPTHSVAALGPLANWLVAGHERCPTPCGKGTPYAKILNRDGQILLLGVGLESNTTFHTVEAMVGVPYLLRDAADAFTIIDQSSVGKNVCLRRHRNGISRRFEATESLLVENRIVRRGLVGKAPSLLIAGRAFRDHIAFLLCTYPKFLLRESDGERNLIDTVS